MRDNEKIFKAYGKCFQDGVALGHCVKADFRLAKINIKKKIFKVKITRNKS